MLSTSVTVIVFSFIASSVEIFTGDSEMKKNVTVPTAVTVT